MELRTEQQVRDIIQDDDNIVKLISKEPQTYNTILQEYRNNGTFHQILRRRVRRLLKEDRIWKLRVPGTRFGLSLLCTPEHEYKILVLQQVFSPRIFYMFDFHETSEEIVMNIYWEIQGPSWSYWTYSLEPLHIPKYMLRGNGFRLWQ